jgi:hypothetical protein
MWKNAEDNDNSEKIQALSLAKECYSKQQRRLSSNNNKDCNESKEPEYAEDEKSDKEGEEKQEKETREISIITKANQVL